MKNVNYEEFVEKFKPKKTTDDCYTPPIIYDAVLNWVRENIIGDSLWFARSILVEIMRVMITRKVVLSSIIHRSLYFLKSVTFMLLVIFRSFFLHQE